jgi:polyisoprenoid-binding protein YceI
MPSGWAEAEVEGFRSGNHTRDEHVREILGAPASPRVRFQLQKLEGFAPAGGGQAVAVGTLAANGHVHPVRVPIHYQVEHDTLRIEGDAPLRFQDFGIDPPVLGLVLKRAPDAFQMHVRLVATAAR